MNIIINQFSNAIQLIHDTARDYNIITAKAAQTETVCQFDGMYYE